MRRPITIDHPENVCFGCSPHNERGMRMEFVLIGPREVECVYTVPDHMSGARGVAHGGVQAVLLDEVMGVSAHQGDGEDFDIVTVDFRLRYRAPVPTGVPIVVRGRCEKVEGRDYHMSGAILSEDGRELTLAEARWKRIPPRR
jgi:acyl-coenzyme A thioesterase PaaI-like protein